jgi:hypothetical protein
MADLLLRAYKAAEAMEPIAMLDYYVRIITYNEPKGFYRKVSYYEAIPPFQAVDLGVIAAQSVGAKTNVTNLDLWDDEFGQWRWFPLDNAQYSLFIPAGVSKWQLKNLTIGLDKSIILRDPLLVSTEFCSWEDQRPAMQAMNFSDYAIAASRIIVFGYRYHTVEVDQVTYGKLANGSIPSTPIQCAGMGGAGR